MDTFFSAKLHKELSKVSALLKKDVSTEPIIKSLYEYIFERDGKKLRPLVNLIFSRGSRSNKRINLATIIELLHVATLVHDDVVDKAKIRRGKKAVNTVWTNSHSVLIGDYIYSKAFIKMVELQRLDILEELSNATNDIAKGELLQLTLFNKEKPITKNKCLEIAYFKTGRLFEAASVTGAMMHAHNYQQLNLARSFGKNIGIAFQIKDDLLDFDLSSASGKEKFKDFSEGKYTLPLILALSGLSGSSKKLIDGKFGQKLTKSQKEDIYSVMYSTNAIKKCENILAQYIELAQQAVKQLQKNMDCNDLNELIGYSSIRSL